MSFLSFTLWGFSLSALSCSFFFVLFCFSFSAASSFPFSPLSVQQRGFSSALRPDGYSYKKKKKKKIHSLLPWCSAELEECTSVCVSERASERASKRERERVGVCVSGSRLIGLAGLSLSHSSSSSSSSKKMSIKMSKESLCVGRSAAKGKSQHPHNWKRRTAALSAE